MIAVTKETLLDELLRINDSDFARVKYIFETGRARETYGPAIAGALSSEFLHEVLQRRVYLAQIKQSNNRAMSGPDPHGIPPGYRGYDQVREWDMMRDAPYNYTRERTTIDEPKTAREAELFDRINKLKSDLKKANDRADMAEGNLAGLRQTFISLFGEGAAEDNLTVERGPDEVANAVGTSLRSWRVRVHVPAFTVETTMQELVMAREQQEAVAKWIHNYSQIGMVSMDARPHITKMIASRIIDSSNKMESLEPEAIQNKEEPK